MIEKATIDALQSYLGKTVTNSTTVSGGDINDAYCIQTASGKFFLKLNDASKFPGMFAAEAEGLALIKGTQTIAVPEVLLHGEAGRYSFLLLEWIQGVRGDRNSQVKLGTHLAAMHSHTATTFGLDAYNYMGSLHQSNKHHTCWADFFVKERLQPMVNMAVDGGQLSISDTNDFEKLYNKLSELFEEERPALIHGDLWGGNYLTGENGKPYLIDPAVSYGHREFDIAMTTLFGGFSTDFYDAYNEAFPLTHGWQQRLPLWNLYPLLAHVNLFGGSYRQQTLSALRKYI